MHSFLPIVLYRGRSPWRAATELADLMLPAPDGLQHLQARQRYLLIDQHHGASVAGSGNVVAILFELMRSRTDGEMRAALHLFAERMKAPDMLAARDNLARWISTTLQEEFSETSIGLEEVPIMLFDKKFKRYEDLLEYEAVGKGRKEGLRLALQSVVKAQLDVDAVPADMSQKISEADTDQLLAWIKSLAGGTSPKQLFA